MPCSCRPLPGLALYDASALTTSRITNPNSCGAVSGASPPAPSDLFATHSVSLLYGVPPPRSHGTSGTVGTPTPRAKGTGPWFLMWFGLQGVAIQQGQFIPRWMASEVLHLCWRKVSLTIALESTTVFPSDRFLSRRSKGTSTLCEVSKQADATKPRVFATGRILSKYGVILSK